MSQKLKSRLPLFLCICLPLLLCAACNIFIIGPRDPDKPDPDPDPPAPEKEYEAEILWNREFTGYDCSAPVIEGQYCYFSVRSSSYYVVKTDLETGTVMWESDWVRDYGSGGNPQKIGDYVYQQFAEGYILALNDSDGKLAATIMLGDTDVKAKQYAGKSYYQCAADKYLYWGNYTYLPDMGKGLMRLDTAAIDFDTDPETVQVIIPQLVWSDSQAAAYIDTSIIPENGIIYFLSHIYSLFTDGGYEPVLAAINADTGSVIWEKEIPPYNSNNDFELVINADKLFVAKNNLSCYDKSTGDLKYGVPIVDNEEDNYYNYLRITRHNNFLYCNNQRKKLVVINTDTGELVWSKPIAESHYFNSYPRINGETLYTASNTGLRVYNAANGDFLGVDGSIKTGDSIMYNDTLIFIGEDSDYNTLYMTGIKCQ